MPSITAHSNLLHKISCENIMGYLVGKFKHTFEYFKQHYTHFFTHTYIKNTQTTLLKLLCQSSPTFLYFICLNKTKVRESFRKFVCAARDRERKVIGIYLVLIKKLHFFRFPFSMPFLVQEF